jgi:hypothetical protein
MAWNTPLNPAREAELEYEERRRTVDRREIERLRRLVASAEQREGKPTA